MKKLLKSVLSFFSASALLVSLLGAAVAAENAGVLKIRPMYLPDELSASDTEIAAMNPGAAGGDATVDGQWWGLVMGLDNPSAGRVTLSTCHNYTPFTAYNLKLDSTSIEYDRVNEAPDYPRRNASVNVMVTGKNAVTLKGGTGVMVYLKMSQNSKQFAPYFITSGGSWNFRVKTGLPYYTLKKGEAAWQSAEGPDGEIISLPENGFEGYLFIPKSTLANGDNTDWDTESITRIQYQFGRYGGEEGAVYFSAPIVTLSDPLEMTDFSAVEVEGNSEIQRLFTSKYLGVRAMKMPSDINRSRMTIAAMNPGAAGGDATVDGKWWGLVMGLDNPSAGRVTLSSCPNYMPFTAYNLKLDSTALEYDRVNEAPDYPRRNASVNVMVTEENAVPLNGGTGVMLYLKMPQNSKWFAPYFITSGGSWNFRVKTGLPYYTLKKGETAWQSAAGPDGELVMLPENGFEGYLFIPKSTLSNGDGTDWNTESITRIQYQFGRYGGEDGAVYFSLPVVTLDDPLSVENTTLALAEGASEPTDLFAEVSYADGDLNLDGCVDILDVIVLKKMLCGYTIATDRADIDKNGRVEAADLAGLRKLILTGLPDL